MGMASHSGQKVFEKIKIGWIKKISVEKFVDVLNYVRCIMNYKIISWKGSYHSWNLEITAESENKWLKFIKTTREFLKLPEN